VTAISCQAQAKYNAFVNRFRSDLVSFDKSLNGYFSRAFGHRATQEHDNYITLLANSQSETGLQRGTLFCQENVGIFDEVLGLKTAADLPTFAAGKSLAQPMPVVVCPAPEPKAARTVQASAKK
jgi:hypothetical protein